MHSVEESLLQSRHSFGREIDTASGREITTDYLLYRLWCSGAAVYVPIIRSAAAGVNPINYPACSTLLCLAIPQPTLRSALPVDIPTDYPPLYSACRYYN
jgi:hypothetical protein